MIQRQHLHVNSHKKNILIKLAKDFMIADNKTLTLSTAWRHTKPQMLSPNKTILVSPQSAVWLFSWFVSIGINVGTYLYKGPDAEHL